MPRARTKNAENTFLEALRYEIAAGNDSLSSWIKSIQSSGYIERLFELETWLKGVRSFLNIEHLPLAEAEKEDLLNRSFLSEIRIARQVIQMCEDLACTLLAASPPDSFEIDALIENQIRKDRIMEWRIGRFLDQMTPGDSVSKLLDSLNDLRISMDAYRKLPNPGYQLYLALGRNYRQELKNCRFIDMLINQRFRIQYDLIDNSKLTEALRSISDELTRRNAALSILYLFRIFKYLDLVHEDLVRDRSLRHHIVLFSLIHEEMANISSFLKKNFVKGKEISQGLRNAADMAVYSLQTESRKVPFRELLLVANETDPKQIYTRIENSHGLIRNCCQANIIYLVSAIDNKFDEASLFPRREARIEAVETVRRGLWDLRKWLMQIMENETAPDFNEIIDRITGFKDTHSSSLMYRDWVEFENFVETLTVCNDSGEILANIRKFLDFIEDLIQEVSKRGSYQTNLKI